eukprot:m.75779 g.75779  ORF g.75779 m.75779 type:complete len:677 (+) comp17187_c0_seq2:403-2433(+)
MSDLDYFHGSISRVDAESLLKPTYGTGTFLVRCSSQVQGEYVLSLLNVVNKKTEYLHFQIKSQGECWFSVDDGPLFEGLDACITHYRIFPDGLPCVLFSSISRPKKRTREVESAGNLALHNAAKIGQTAVLRNSAADARRPNAIGRLPLHEACRYGQLAFVEGLLGLRTSHPFDLNAVDEDGWTALHFAAFAGVPAIVKLLILQGARFNLKTLDGETAQNIAARLGNTDACKLLGDAEQQRTTEAAMALVAPPYFHGRVNRKVAEFILQKNGSKDGQFLVRESQGSGDFVLSMTCQIQPFHFQIRPNAQKTAFNIDDGPQFAGIPQVLEYYRSKADGLPTLLTSYCPRGGYSKGGKAYDAGAAPGDFGAAHKISDLKFDIGIYAQPNESAAAIKPPKPAGTALIRQEDLTLGDKIGEGEFGAVFKGSWREPGGATYQVAVKTLHPHSELENPESQLCQDFLREADVMAELQHPNVVRLMGVVRYTQPMMIVQELVPLGSLQDYLEDHKKQIPVRTMTSWAHQIANGMSFLEEKKFVHRDLASRNILVQSQEVVKISDFGFSRAIGADDNYYKASQGGKWPMKWYAPECLYYFRFSHKSDVWSFGVTLWEIFTYAEMPYGEMSGREVLDQLTQGIRLPQPPDCPKEVYRVMRTCWEFEQENRPTFKTLTRQLASLVR